MNKPENIKNNLHEDILPGINFPEPVPAVVAPVEAQPFQDVLPISIPGAMTPISPEKQSKRGWRVHVNGVEQTDAGDVKIRNDKLGLEVRYGNTEDGYDNVQFTEAGGPVTVPYMQTPDGRLYVGLVYEQRQNMGGLVWNVPRGMLDRHETIEDAAKRELHEETGHNLYNELGSRMVRLATGLNSNSAITNTSQSKEQGATFFAINVKQSELEPQEGEDGNIYYVFPKHVQAQAEGDKTGERILGSRFIPIHVALKSRDMYTAAGAGFLQNYIDETHPKGMSESARQQLREFNKRPDRAIR